MRERHIKWITNARTSKVDSDTLLSKRSMTTVRSRQRTNCLLPSPCFCQPSGSPGGLWYRRTYQSTRFHRYRQISAQSGLPEYLRGRRLCCHSPVGKTPLAVGVPKTGFMIESMVTAAAENIAALLRGRSQRPSQAGTRSVLPISATKASLSSHNRKFRRAM